MLALILKLETKSASAPVTIHTFRRFRKRCNRGRLTSFTPSLPCFLNRSFLCRGLLAICDVVDSPVLVLARVFLSLSMLDGIVVPLRCGSLTPMHLQTDSQRHREMEAFLLATVPPHAAGPYASGRGAGDGEHASL